MANETNSKSRLAGGAKPNDAASKPAVGTVNGATPNDGIATLYQGQKVALSVSTSNLKASNYTSIAFQVYSNDDFSVLDGTKSGLVVHPDSAAKATQPITTSDTYTLDGIVFGQASTSNLGLCRWNIAVTGQLPTLTLNGTHLGASTDFGYGTSSIKAGELYGIKRIPGNTTNFDASAAIAVNAYQISDASKNPITNATFSACIRAKHGDLTYFDFWDSNRNKLSKIQRNGKDTYVWVDSDATGQFTFYVTSNLATGMYSDTLVMAIGNENPEIAQVIVGNPATVGPSSGLPAPVPDNAEGSSLMLPSAGSIVMVSIPQPFFPDAIQPGDVLIPSVNAVPQLNAFFIADSRGASNGFPDCFAIPVSALSVSEGGANNVLQYLVLRNNLVSLSSEFPFDAYGAGSSGIQPYPSMVRYLAPIIVGNEAYLDVDFDMVEKGLTVKISWDGAGWAPVTGDVLKLYIAFVGWNASGAVNQAPVVSFPPIIQADLTNKYAVSIIDYKYFAGFINGPGGHKSTVFMQYEVPDDGTNVQGYSLPTPNMGIDTVPPGGL